LFSILVLILGVMQWTRAAGLFARRSFLLELGVSLPLTYAILSAALWGGALLAAAAGLWRLHRWGRRLALIAVTGSQIQSWLDRLFFARSDYAQISTGFALGATLILLIVTWGVLYLPSIQKRFETKG
jgi:hypothetical protein